MEKQTLGRQKPTVSLLRSFRPSLLLPHPLPPFLSLAYLLTESWTFGLPTSSIAIAISSPASIPVARDNCHTKERRVLCSSVPILLAFSWHTFPSTLILGPQPSFPFVRSTSSIFPNTTFPSSLPIVNISTTDEFDCDCDFDPLLEFADGWGTSRLWRQWRCCGACRCLIPQHLSLLCLWSCETKCVDYLARRSICPSVYHG